MTERRPQMLSWTYVVYSILVIAMTVFLLHGRAPITDRNVTAVEMALLLPGIILYLPLLLLSGGVHWSLLPFWARMPLWGALNVLGYLAIPVATQGIFGSWQQWKASGKQGSFWLEMLRRPSVLIAAGVLCMLLGLNGVLQIRRDISGPTDYANVVLGPLAAIGFWCLAYYLYRYGTVTGLHGKSLPAWTRWAVPLAAVIGAMVGGGLAYGEVRILRWSPAAAGILAVTVTVVTVAVVLTLFHVMRKHTK
ncbi:MAG: hypothetical protein ACE5IQ_00530 [Candidatus Methylomirabilales bacterium]